MKPKYKEGQIVISTDGRWWLIKRMKVNTRSEAPCNRCDLRRLKICDSFGTKLEKLFGDCDCVRLIGSHVYDKPETLLAFVHIDKEGGGV